MSNEGNKQQNIDSDHESKIVSGEQLCDVNRHQENNYNNSKEKYQSNRARHQLKIQPSSAKPFINHHDNPFIRPGSRQEAHIISYENIHKLESRRRAAKERQQRKRNNDSPLKKKLRQQKDKER